MNFCLSHTLLFFFFFLIPISFWWESVWVYNYLDLSFEVESTWVLVFRYISPPSFLYFCFIFIPLFFLSFNLSYILKGFLIIIIIISFSFVNIIFMHFCLGFLFSSINMGLQFLSVTHWPVLWSILPLYKFGHRTHGIFPNGYSSIKMIPLKQKYHVRENTDSSFSEGHELTC